jgi:hypothetical protein
MIPQSFPVCKSFSEVCKNPRLPLGKQGSCCIYFFFRPFLAWASLKPTQEGQAMQIEE